MASDLNYVSSCTQRFLELLDEYNTQITFFITGNYYHAFPEMVERIYQCGHEIAYHGHTHQKLTDSEILHQELILSADFLNQYAPKGFRAPWVYLPESLLPMLAEAGFEYDSSTLAVAGHYTMAQGISTFPVTSIPFFSNNIDYPKIVNTKMLYKEIPIGTGIMVSYFRKWYSALLTRYTNKHLPCIFYLHLWQIYPPPNATYQGLRRIHAYPLEQYVRKWLQTHTFGKVSELMTTNQPDKHFLTIDLEI